MPEAPIKPVCSIPVWKLRAGMARLFFTRRLTDIHHAAGAVARHGPYFKMCSTMLLLPLNKPGFRTGSFLTNRLQSAHYQSRLQVRSDVHMPQAVHGLVVKRSWSLSRIRG